MTVPRDHADNVRPGEEIDPAALGAYLKAHQGLASVPTIRQFRGGHSNLTYLVMADGYDYVLRRPPFGNQVKTAHDMSREFRILSALAPVFPPVRYGSPEDDRSRVCRPSCSTSRRRG